jgi:hypothetical protein
VLIGSKDKDRMSCRAAAGYVGLAVSELGRKRRAKSPSGVRGGGLIAGGLGSRVIS